MAGGVGAIAGALSRTAKVNDRLDSANAGVANATSPAQQTAASRNLSRAQFAKNVNTASNTAEVAGAMGPGGSSTPPDIGDPAWSPPNSIPGGLYT